MDLPLNEYSITEIIEIGKIPIVANQIANTAVIKMNKKYNKREAIEKIQNIQNEFNRIFRNKSKLANDLLKHEVLFNNYSQKNKMILKDLKNKIKLQKLENTDKSEQNFTNIQIVKNKNYKIKQLITTNRIILIVNVILLILLFTFLFLSLIKFNNLRTLRR